VSAANGSRNIRADNEQFYIGSAIASRFQFIVLTPDILIFRMSFWIAFDDSITIASDQHSHKNRLRQALGE
jgi:hypothetical protein